MITVEEAKSLLSSHVGKSTPALVDITEAFGCVLADDVFSPADLPSFNQSAMDGYAVSVSNTFSKEYKLVGEIKAGDNGSSPIHSGEAVRIFTGAVVPVGADAVVIQEKTEQVNGSIHVGYDFNQGDCIRLKGSQIRKGEIALAKGSVLNPAAIGFLASLGIQKIRIYKRPDVSVITTGNELVSPGNFVNSGQVFESNSFSILAALSQLHIKPQQVFTVVDELNELKQKINQCLVGSDILILTGGISVGKYDLVHEALNDLNVETIFYKVAQKPGKPFYFGKLNNKLVFALPGNPAAVLVCFYEYIYPAIRLLQGFENPSLPSMHLNLQKPIFNKEDRSLFVRAKKTNDGILPLAQQDSNSLKSFAEADALIYIPGGRKEISQGESVEVHLLTLYN